MAPGERAFVADLFGSSLDAEQVRVVSGFRLFEPATTAPLPPKSGKIDPRPGVCDRINPDPPVDPPPAWALYNQVHLVAEFYRPDTVPGWPDQVLLPEALIMAHELVHVWQWQNRKRTGYRPAKAGLESFLNRDPYFYVPDEGAGFLEYGFEQQASLLEDYMCYGIFDPKNPRRTKLRKILEPYFRVDRIDEVFAP
ncbi:MAG: hypothetical protein LJE68_11240 [Rhodobacter sp.]|nr:hypothetical protein [Rhodobacter sp.]